MTRRTFHRAQGRVRLASLALVLVATGCGTEPGELYDWTGTWEGNVSLSAQVTPSESTRVTGTGKLELTQAGTQISGTWSGTIPPVAGLSGELRGSVTGTVTDTMLTMTVNFATPPPCSLSGQGTRSGETVTGTLKPQLCLIPIEGTFSLTKK